MIEKDRVIPCKTGYRKESITYVITSRIHWRGCNPLKWSPPTDLYETIDRVTVKVEIAGMTEDDFAIVFSDNTLKITGIRRCDVVDEMTCYQMEILYGEFETVVPITRRIDADRIHASYKNGFLTIVLPKINTTS